MNTEPLPTQYRYDLRVEIPATAVAVLVDALEGEPLDLRRILGDKELDRMIREQEIVVHEESAERWPAFEKDIQILSVYLSEYIVGRELIVHPTEGAPRLEGFTIVGHGGEAVRMPLVLRWDPADQSVIDEGEDVDDLARRWDSLPDWLREAMRRMHPQLSGR